MSSKKRTKDWLLHTRVCRVTNTFREVVKFLLGKNRSTVEGVLGPLASVNALHIVLLP